MRRMVAPVIAAVAVVALSLGLLTVARVAAATSTVKNVSAGGVVAADPYAFWYGQVNAVGVCRLFPGCTGVSGSRRDWNLQLTADLPGIGLQSVPAQIRVVKQVPFRSMRMQLASTTPAGTLTADLKLALKARGRGTRVTLTIVSAQATGALQPALAQVTTGLAPTIASYVQDLNDQQRTAGVGVTLTARKGKASVRVTAPSLTSTPTTATGRLRVMRGNATVCSARLARSAGSCRVPRSAQRGTLRAVVTGSLSNGYPLWSSATGRYRR